MAPTRPSIMSDGATTSAPAAACDSAARTSCSTVGSFAISSSTTIPQCPCDVYSHRHTSVTTSRPGTSRLIARRQSGPALRVYAPEPTASFVSGRPNRRTPGIPFGFRRSGFPHRFVHRQLADAGHRSDFAPLSLTRTDEQRIDEHVGSQAGLANERSNGGIFSQAARPPLQELTCPGCSPRRRGPACDSGCVLRVMSDWARVPG